MLPARRLPRRQLLVGGAAAAAASTLLRPRQAAAFGAAPPGSVMLPEELRVESILEFYLFGGISQYESFYCVPAHGDSPSDPRGWHLHLNSGEIEQTLADCNFSGDLLLEFDADAVGEKVFLGPFIEPLRQREDILERMRICVTAHGAFPHEVAVPLALAGRPLGHPHLAGIGAHIQRFFQARDGNSSLPVSYVLRPSDEIVADLGSAASATGVHPATAAPVTLVVDEIAKLYSLLDRTTLRDSGLGDRRAQHDALVAANIERYRRRLMFGGAGEPLRAARFGEALAASNAVSLASDIRAMLGSDILEPIPGSSCDASTEHDMSTMGVRLAARLLDSGARYVCVLENGMVDTLEAGGFDTHANNCPFQAKNVIHAMHALTSVIKNPNGGGPSLDGQPLIDLDKTLVIINTEFGRTPYADGALGTNNPGRGHWPLSFPVIMLGGPMRRGITGATNPAFEAEQAIDPVHHRIAALLAMGIWPFADESFNVADVYFEAAPTENDAVQYLLDRIFAV